VKILAVEDDPVARRVLRQALEKLGHEVLEAADGEAALDVLAREKIPVVVSDWVMPRRDGLRLCEAIRARAGEDYVYFILLTAQSASQANQREAADAGVDDFLSKPLDVSELWRRLRVAGRILDYFNRVRTLEAIIQMCSYCKKVRDDQNYWQQVESYLNQHTGADISHSVCPDCYQRVVIPELDKLRQQAGPDHGRNPP
jgi:phosphoserine phosphatase RsbU/P